MFVVSIHDYDWSHVFGAWDDFDTAVAFVREQRPERIHLMEIQRFVTNVPTGTDDVAEYWCFHRDGTMTHHP